MSKSLNDKFREYMSSRYGAKGRRSIMYAGRIDELDILLGVKDATDFDDEDKKFLSQGQLDELEKLSNNLIKARKDMEEDIEAMNRKYV